MPEKVKMLTVLIILYLLIFRHTKKTEVAGDTYLS